MTHTSRSTGCRRFARLILLAVGTALAAGCGSLQPPVKMIHVPSGGEPILTSAEREQIQDGRQQHLVAPAAFARPIEEPPPEPLLKPFDQWSEQEAAADALGRIGPAAVPALLQALASPEKAMRLKATEVLGRMGPEAKDAVPDLVRLLEDPDLAVRKAATRTLGRIGPAAGDAVPALMRSLEPSSPPDDTPLGPPDLGE